jgi:two-component system sensor histidine kinase KdpD
MSQKDFCRPDPEELLRQIQAQEINEARGRLKIFLGYAPRVGKSERMFDEGRRRLRRGQDVVIGVIQTKGSAELERMIREFEVIPAAQIEGSTTVDVDAVLARHPQVCLIDELARDNPPGSRFNHRWQDVEELLAHGINVVGAINLQHVCEEQDAVERITGRRSSHAVPASFIHSADELTIVDVPPEELAPDRGGAVSLTPDQLSQLRELALLLAAQVVEEQLQRYMDAHGIHQSWGTQERILVCITPRSSARSMLESGARATERFHGHMCALSVKQGELSREAEEALRNNLDYARKLGAEVHILEAKDPIAAILDFAREQRITQVFIGHTQRPAWKFWERSPVDRLIQAAEGMDVRLFPHRTAA